MGGGGGGGGEGVCVQHIAQKNRLSLEHFPFYPKGSAVMPLTMELAKRDTSLIWTWPELRQLCGCYCGGN